MSGAKRTNTASSCLWGYSLVFKHACIIRAWVADGWMFEL